MFKILSLLLVASVVVAQDPGCVSLITGGSCMSLLSGNYTLSWMENTDTIDMAISASTTGWVGLAWAANAGMMIGSTSVVAWIDSADVESIGVYLMEGRAPDMFVSVATPIISGTSVTQTSGVTTAMFTLDTTTVPGSAPYNMLAAYSSDNQDALAYHGATTRTGFTWTP